MDDAGTAETGRPLTRREMRALEAARSEGVDGTAESAQPVAAEAEAEDWPVAGSTLGETTWSENVRWSLHGELPRELPLEPEVDDVRWADVEDTVPGPVGGALHDWEAPAVAEPEGEAWVEQPEGEAWVAEPEGEAWVEQPDASAWTVPPEQPPANPSAPTRVSAWQLAGDEPVGSPLPPVTPLVAPDDEPAGAGWPEPADDWSDADPEPLQTAAFAPEVAPPAPEELPTLSDLLAARPALPDGPAEQGWQGTVRRITGGLLALRPGPAERHHRAAVASVQRTLDGPRTVVVINPKGGAHKTTASLLLAATFGQHRGGYTLAWDNNETRGTLGWRAAQAGHHRTAVDLLQDLDRFADPGHARVGDLDNYVRSQGAAQFDVLASDEDAASAGSIDDFAFRALHRTLARFYRIMVIDTGNNMRASNWQAAIEAADQVVIVSTVREDTAQSAAWAIDALRATGYEDVVRRAVTVLSDPAPRRDTALSDRLHDHFSRLTRAVVDVPHDRSLVGGTPLEWERLQRRTREAWLEVASAVADGL